MPVMHTCSQVIEFSQELEETSAGFYEQLEKDDPERNDIFASFAMQNRKLASGIKRAYISSISDAIEGCFAFQVERDEYAISGFFSKPAGWGDAVARALEIEKVIARFYKEASEQSKGLLPDVSRAFIVAVNRRTSRIDTLRSLGSKQETSM